MKISLRWLNDYIDLKKYFEMPEELAALLTGAGLEVEALENRAKDFHYVVIGHILEKKAHPNADKLSLCQVQTGQGVVHSIVCGAKNHKEGDRVVVALPGAVLPGNFAIKLSKIRGVESAGMLCSEKELGLAAESGEGILILPPSAPLGESFAAYRGLDDVIFDLKVTPNRADCLSHFGLARELSCLLGLEANVPFETFSETTESTKKTTQLSVKDTARCPRYTGRLIRGVKVGPSPDWMKRRLEFIGLKSINNIVDITNYVMMELGQPLHAFDLREIRGGHIIVDSARAGETFRTFDGTDLKLDGTELMIRDSERPVALAGVIGGVNSGIQNDTRDIFLESAYFNPAAVRKTARKFGIETDSSYRFSRGCDPEATLLGLNRACELVQKFAGGEVTCEPHDHYPNPVKRAHIEITAEQVSERLGFKVPDEKLSTVLRSLGCQLETLPKTGWKVSPPQYRGDLQIAEDLMEEYARVTGYDQIPDTLPLTTSAPTSDVSTFTLNQRVSDFLRREGYLEALNFSFIGSNWQSQILGSVAPLNEMGLETATEPVSIKNPLNEELNVMRVSLTPGLVKNISHNCRHGGKAGRLFETGLVFQKTGEHYREDWRLGMALWGEEEVLWKSQKPAPPVLTLKTSVENLLTGLLGRNWKWRQPKTVPAFLHPGQCTELFFEGKSVGFIGTLHPLLCEKLDIRVPAAMAELNLGKLLEGQPRWPKTKSLSKFPAVERDLAFVMPKSLPVADVMDEMKKAAGASLQSVQVFDLFEGGSLNADQRSVAFRLTFQDKEATLTDEKITELHKNVMDSVSKALKIQVR